MLDWYGTYVKFYQIYTKNIVSDNVYVSDNWAYAQEKQFIRLM